MPPRLREDLDPELLPDELLPLLLLLLPLSKLLLDGEGLLKLLPDDRDRFWLSHDDLDGELDELLKLDREGLDNVPDELEVFRHVLL